MAASGVLLILVACGPNGPASVKDCVVRSTDVDHVRLEASVEIHGKLVAQRVSVLLSTAGRNRGSGPGSGGSLVEYQLDGPFPPDVWIRAHNQKAVSDDPFSLDQHLGDVSNCYAHAVYFNDGSHWEGPSPL
jgi:hypothetical protein